MNLTQVLALVGAVTGVTGAALGISTFVRDRARLVIFVHMAWERTPQENFQGESFATIYVVNAGRQPIAIIGVGIGLPQRRWRITFQSPNFLREVLSFGRRRNIRKDSYALSLDDEPVLLKPAELKRFSLAGGPRIEGYSKPFKAFAIDYRYSFYWANTPLSTAKYQLPRSQTD